MRTKKVVFVDFDDTLVNSTETVVDVYNKRYKDNVDWRDVTKWELAEECTLIGSKLGGNSQLEIQEIYASAAFWKNIQPFPGAVEALSLLKRKGFTVILVSIGNPGNMSYKYTYAEKHFPNIFDEIYGIHHRELPHSKTRLNMRGSFMIDDDEEILKRTSASHKVHFIKIKQSEIRYGFEKHNDWSELAEYILDTHEKSRLKYSKKKK